MQTRCFFPSALGGAHAPPPSAARQRGGTQRGRTAPTPAPHAPAPYGRSAKRKCAPAVAVRLPVGSPLNAPAFSPLRGLPCRCASLAALARSGRARPLRTAAWLPPAFSLGRWVRASRSPAARCRRGAPASPRCAAGFLRSPLLPSGAPVLRAAVAGSPRLRPCGLRAAPLRRRGRSRFALPSCFAPGSLCPRVLRPLRFPPAGVLPCAPPVPAAPAGGSGEAGCLAAGGCAPAASQLPPGSRQAVRPLILAAAGKGLAGRFPPLPLPLRYIWRKGLTFPAVCATLVVGCLSRCFGIHPQGCPWGGERTPAEMPGFFFCPLCFPVFAHHPAGIKPAAPCVAGGAPPVHFPENVNWVFLAAAWRRFFLDIQTKTAGSPLLLFCFAANRVPLPASFFRPNATKPVLFCCVRSFYDRCVDRIRLMAGKLLAFYDRHRKHGKFE